MLRLRGSIEGKQVEVPLDGEEVSLGRGAENDIVLSDVSVSRRHAVFRSQKDGWFVYDLKSTNGVQLNQVTVKKAPIKAGDRITIGVFELEVTGEDEPHAPPEEALQIEGEAPPSGAGLGAGTSSATIVRSLADFSADYGLEATAEEKVGPPEPRQPGDFAYAARIVGYLTRLGQLLIKAESVDDVLEKVMGLAFEALPVDRGYILLSQDEGDQALACELTRIRDEVELRPQGEVPVSHTILETVIRDRVALLTYDALADPRLASGESIRIHQIRSAMCVPLWSGERIIGVIQVDTPFQVGRFTEKDLDFLTALGNYAAVAVERLRYARRIEFERHVRARLERYHSPAVIEEVLRQDQAATEEGLRHLKVAEVTVLFADLVDFTSFSETSRPEDVAELLFSYFTHSVGAIFAQGGTLDKFIGDSVMAFFGAPVAQDDHALRAVRAAVAIQEALDAWNREREVEGLPPVAARLGLNSGPVVVGDIGSERRVDYTVLGNTVNVAARLEELVAKPGDIVLGGSTFAQIEGEVEAEPLGEVPLKGLQQKVAAYKVRRTTG